MAIVAVMFFSPVTVYVHEPPPIGLNVNGPLPDAGVTLTTVPHVPVVNVKPPVFAACVNATPCAGAVVPLNDSEAGEATIAVDGADADGDGDGDGDGAGTTGDDEGAGATGEDEGAGTIGEAEGAGCPGEDGAGTGAPEIPLGGAMGNVDPPPPPPPQAVSERTKPRESAGITRAALGSLEENGARW